MSRGRGGWLAAALSLAVLAASGCSVLQAPGGGFNLIAVDEEWELGAQLVGEIAQQMTVVSDAEADAFLTGLGTHLLAVSISDLARLPWTFHLVLDDSVNAFNIPGGHVYINTGLVTAMENYAELAAVVGHEIGHGLNRHGTQHLSAQYGSSLLASLALGGDPNQVEQFVAGFVSGGAMMKFSRDDELEADRSGIHLTYYSGIDPRGAINMFEVLDALSDRDPNAIEQFLASHPLPEDRISEAWRRISSLPNPEALTYQTDEYQAFRARVKALTAGGGA